MPRLATVVFAATILIVAFNLIPSGRYTTILQRNSILYEETQEAVSTTIGNATDGGASTLLKPLVVANGTQKVHTDGFRMSNITITSASPLSRPPTSNTTKTQSQTKFSNGTGHSPKTLTNTFNAPSTHQSAPIFTTNLSEFLKETRRQLVESSSTKAWSNVSTYAFGPTHLISGYRNQIMSLAMLMMKANQEGHQQFLLDSLQHKDTYGTNQFVPFEVYFDVQHWNSYYNATEYRIHGANANEAGRHPTSLPRLVYHEPRIHYQWDTTTNRYIDAVSNGTVEPTHPYGYMNPSTRLQMTYQRYAKGKTKFIQQHSPKNNKSPERNIFERSTRNPAEILMLQGALRPNPTLQSILESLLEQMKQKANQNTSQRGTSDKNNNNDWSYMTLHARVEPDMQRHPVCPGKKVRELDKIIRWIEAKFPEPPVSIVFMPINRQYLEKEGTLPIENQTTNRNGSSINWIAVENLRELNRITQQGLWNGTVPVVEFGANALKGTVYEHRPSTAGAILNFFLTLQPQCSVFVGTEVSSFSHDVLASRFYRGYVTSNGAAGNGKDTSKRQYRNYKYLPEGLVDWITPDMVDSPGFLC
jgi:hypothetical protein